MLGRENRCVTKENSIKNVISEVRAITAMLDGVMRNRQKPNEINYSIKLNSK